MPSHYVDLSDAQYARFGTECPHCAARYVTPLMDGAHTESARRAALEACDSAWHELQVICPRCERLACPFCWDSGHRMCIDCAEAHGLTHTPPTPPARGPLADGRLTLVQPGKYSSLQRPAWVGDLLAASADTGPDAADGGRHAVAAGHVEPEMRTRTGAGNSAREAYHDASFSAGGDVIANAPTERMPTSPSASSPLPPPSLPPSEDVPLPHMDMRIPNAEGAITSNMIECPRCGSLNYDFVTRCGTCQLQLIQLCPRCERLNPGQAVVCDACGAPLSRPPGWSGVLEPQPPAVERAFQRTILADEPPEPPEPRVSPVPSQPRKPTPSQPPTPVLPYMPTIREYRASEPAYMPGARPPAPGLLPATRDRRNRRRTASATPGRPPGILSTAAAAYLPTDSDGALAVPEERRSGLIGAILDRLASLGLLLVILMLVGSIVAAELSPGANDALRSLIHIDIRQTLGHFGDAIHTLLKRLHH
jgi:hypothetical protein